MLNHVETTHIMKLRFLLIPFTAFCMISSCSSCGEGSGGTGSAGDGNLGGTGTGDDTEIVADNGGTDHSELNETEQLQADINHLLEEQISMANSSRSKRVETIIASFELGMNKREVKKHMLRMKQKNHLVRVQKSANVFEYVYQLPLKSGKSNTYFHFEYNRKGGLYKAICNPSKFKKLSKGKFLKEVRDLLKDWYGDPSFQLPNTKGCARYIWINGNRHIDLYCTSKSVEFVFTDLNYELPDNIEGGGKERPEVKLAM